MKSKAFENVKDQIGFCGIWCGSCSGGNGVTVELARRFEEVAKKHRLERWVPKGFDFKEFMKGLACIQAMPLCPGCRMGGGPLNCSIRACAKERGVSDCSQCGQLKKCRNFERLEKENPRIKEDLLKIKNRNRREVVKKWTEELRAEWPHCILLCETTAE